MKRQPGKPDAVFPAPDHDHGRCSSDAMAHAETLCAARGQRLTPIRRQVLETLAQSHRTLGAYEIMDRLAATGPRPAPITVYRALDFLLDNGLVHRIESRNAFLACIGEHGEETAASTLFLICERCGAVGEASSPAVAETLQATARAAGFTPKARVTEITGICAHCA
jgi:Fur family transcriptional regulator, zinc uptake regulator